jgi:hypothetical protein
MPHFKITATYEYEGTIQADNAREAEKIFLKDLNDHYVSTEEFECELVDVCEDCGEDELDLDGSCFDCREDDEEED